LCLIWEILEQIIFSINLDEICQEGEEEVNTKPTFIPLNRCDFRQNDLKYSRVTKGA
jgi:hypothetical protein